MPDVELVCDFAQVRLLVFEPERRTTRRDPQIVDLRERSQNFFSNSVAEISVVFPRTKIGKWQDGDRIFVRGRGPIDVDLVQVGRARDSVAGEIKKPGKDEREWETERDQHDHESRAPNWKVERRKNAGHELNESRAGDDVGNRDGVNFPAL